MEHEYGCFTNTDVAIVNLLRDKENPNNYYILLDNQIERWLNRINDHLGNSLELGGQIELKVEDNNNYYKPALRLADKFIRYLKTTIATQYSDEKFLGGWYEFKDLDSKDNWLENFYAFQQNELSKTSMQSVG